MSIMDVATNTVVPSSQTLKTYELIQRGRTTVANEHVGMAVVSDPGTSSEKTSLILAKDLGISDLSLALLQERSIEVKVRLRLTDGIIWLTEVTSEALNSITSGNGDSIQSNGRDADSAQTVSAPTFSIPGGVHSNAINLALTSTTSESRIYYTTNGSTPTAGSNLYTGPLDISTTTTIKAIALKDGWIASSIAAATYTITPSIGQMGPKSPNTASISTLPGSYDWQSSTSVSGSVGALDGNVASATVPSNLLLAKSFMFNIPVGSTINGIVVEISRSCNVPEGCFDYMVKIIKNDVVSSTNHKLPADQKWPEQPAYATYGGPTSLWGETWTAVDINDPDFGVAITVDGGPATEHIDHIRITVHYTLGHRIFVTSSFYDGNLGGLSGADTKCQTVADNANLYGNWKAILSNTAKPAPQAVFPLDPQPRLLV